MNYYAITAKKTRKPVSQEHYENYLSYCTDLGEVGNVNYERTRGLHIHFIIKTERLDYKRLKPTKYGWSVKAVPIYNYQGWIQYIEKDNAKLSDEEQKGLRKAMLRLNCCNNNDTVVTMGPL